MLDNVKNALHRQTSRLFRRRKDAPTHTTDQKPAALSNDRLTTRPGQFASDGTNGQGQSVRGNAYNHGLSANKPPASSRRRQGVAENPAIHPLSARAAPLVPRAEQPRFSLSTSRDGEGVSGSSRFSPITSRDEGYGTSSSRVSLPPSREGVYETTGDASSYMIASKHVPKRSGSSCNTNTAPVALAKTSQPESAHAQLQQADSDYRQSEQLGISTGSSGMHTNHIDGEECAMCDEAARSGDQGESSHANPSLHVQERSDIDFDYTLHNRAPVTHEEVKPHVHTIYEPRRTRSIHFHEHRTKIQPIIDPEPTVLPEEHWAQDHRTGKIFKIPNELGRELKEKYGE